MPFKQKSLKERKIIALALPLLSEGEIKLAEGVRKGLSENNRPEEVIVLGGGYEATLRRLAEQGVLSGGIGDFMSLAWLESLGRNKVSFVQLGPWETKGTAGVTLDLEAMAADLFRMVESGKVKIEINQRYALKDAQQAHRDLESRKTTGSTILLP